MSLINEMLQDLDRRSAKEQPDNNNPLGKLATPVAAISSGSGFHWLIGIVCFVGLLLLVGMGYRIYGEHKQRINTDFIPYQAAVQPVKPESNRMLQVESTEQIDIERISVGEIPGGARIEVQLSGKVNHRVVLTGDRQLEIYLPKTQLTQHLPLLIEHGLLSALDVATVAEVLVLRVFSREAISFQSYLLNQEDRILLVIDLADSAPKVLARDKEHSVAETVLMTSGIGIPSPQPVAGRVEGAAHSSVELAAVIEKPEITPVKSEPAVLFSKKMRKPSAEERDSSSAERSFALIKAGLSTQAMEELTALVRELPDAHTSREMLVTLLLERKKYSEAAQLISAGLKRNPQNTSLIKLQARLLISGADHRQALELLKNNIGARSKDLEYLSLLAYLYQSESEHSSALELYAALAGIVPDEPRWWVGQGVSLEALGRADEALKVYMRAQRIPQTEGRLKTYIKDRIAALN